MGHEVMTPVQIREKGSECSVSILGSPAWSAFSSRRNWAGAITPRSGSSGSATWMSMRLTKRYGRIPQNLDNLNLDLSGNIMQRVNRVGDKQQVGHQHSPES